MLSEDMMRLCDEVVALRRNRGSLMQDLAQGNRGRKQFISELCSHLSRSRAATAKKARHERLAALHNLQRAVHAQRRDLRGDLAGVRKTWVARGA